MPFPGITQCRENAYLPWIINRITKLKPRFFKKPFLTSLYWDAPQFLSLYSLPSCNKELNPVYSPLWVCSYQSLISNPCIPSDCWKYPPSGWWIINSFLLMFFCLLVQAQMHPVFSVFVYFCAFSHFRHKRLILH